MIIRSLMADGHGVVLTDGLITGISYVDDHAFAEGTTYWYRVLAYDSDYVSSSFSDAVSVTVSQLQTTIAVSGDHSIMVHVAQMASSVSKVEALEDEHSLAVPVEEWQILLLEAPSYPSILGAVTLTRCSLIPRPLPWGL